MQRVNCDSLPRTSSVEVFTFQLCQLGGQALHFFLQPPQALEGLAVVLPSRFQQPAFDTVGDELRSVQVQGLDVESARLAQGAWSRPQNHLATDDGEGP